VPLCVGSRVLHKYCGHVLDSLTKYCLSTKLEVPWWVVRSMA
jgi:hypothetical protein